VIDVLHIEVHPLLEGDLAPAAHLPHAGDPRAHREAAALPRLVLRDLARDRRPRADDGHLAAQHVDELRQLVDAELAHEPADRGDPRIVLDLEHRAALLVLLLERRAQLLGVHDHRPELEHVEEAAVQPDALLLEEHRPARGGLDRDRDGHEERRQQREHHGRDDDVEEALERALDRPLLEGHVVHVAVADHLRIRGARALEAEHARRQRERRAEALAHLHGLLHLVALTDGVARDEHLARRVLREHALEIPRLPEHGRVEVRIRVLRSEREVAEHLALGLLAPDVGARVARERACAEDDHVERRVGRGAHAGHDRA
jgi:hypothetical protein